MAPAKRQDSLPGMEPKAIPELDAVMELYAEKASALSALRQEVGQLKEQLIQEARKAGVTTYRNETAAPPLVLTLTERDVAVKVRAVVDLADNDFGDEVEELDA